MTYSQADVESPTDLKVRAEEKRGPGRKEDGHEKRLEKLLPKIEAGKEVSGSATLVHVRNIKDGCWCPLPKAWLSFDKLGAVRAVRTREQDMEEGCKSVDVNSYGVLQLSAHPIEILDTGDQRV
ncbi:hypothetical protein CLF_101829 [Clonorchis sinensis]|uniref:Uncharacterized protein n=1 Tax=Clonorchis sinensis TaxID=79923 RepID=G7Y6N4_CLOSI|nr:hypothetical protein CLF_101829 [Clonorchis sinensis]